MNRVMLFVLCVTVMIGATDLANAGSREVIDLSGKGWNLWRDTEAKWRDDTLYLPPVKLSELPVNEPTGGWQKLEGGDAIPAAVPGTIEEYMGAGNGPQDFTGVNWWSRKIKIPEFKESEKIFLYFESTRQRAEVYLDGKLVGYDIVGNTPFKVDISDFAQPGSEHQLAVRITNPGGNFSWVDFQPVGWGKYNFPGNHNFSGITGPVKMIVCDPVYVDDIYVQNTPEIKTVNVWMTIQNSLGEAVKKDIAIVLKEWKGGDKLKKVDLKDVELEPGENVLKQTISAEDAQLWGIASPNLYVCEVALKKGFWKDSDSDSQRFGFRWFDMDGVGKDAVLRLNGKRVVLRSAISWGFYPINGSYPTPELAERHVKTAKDLGMNMLNFHRCIGNKPVLDKADELGLLYFEEPGGYVAPGRNEFGMGVASHKLLRMVKRDRSHPSLVIYNMINEQWWLYGAPEEDGPVFKQHLSDMTKAHELDPSRIIVYASSWAEPVKEQRIKLHMRPFDMQPYYSGWYDFHHAGGPATWRSEYYKNPKEMFNYTDNRGEVVFWGEEGAMSSPPRLQKIKEEIAELPNKGWDGNVWLRWYSMMDEFMSRKDLRKYFATVDDLCLAMGKVSHEHQGRRIENIRIQNVADGYAINGWEDEIMENHSGVVDCFRFPKAKPEVMAYYNQPLYVAVKCRTQTVESGNEAMIDLYAVNEENLQGDYTLKITALDPAGKKCFSKEKGVKLAGGDVYGQLIAEKVLIPMKGAGFFKVQGTLIDSSGKELASGRDRVLCVDWKSAAIPANGAIYEQGMVLHDFLADEKNLEVPVYRNDMGKLDWVLVARSAQNQAVPISSKYLRDASGKNEGLTATFYQGRDFKEKIHQRIDKTLDFTWDQGSTPDPEVKTIGNYSVRWEGSIVPPTSGTYTIHIRSDDGVRFWVDGEKLIDIWKDGIFEEDVALQLEEGKAVSVKIELYQAAGGAEMHLAWIPPNTEALDLVKLLERVKNDGTTLVVTDGTAEWVDAIKDTIPIKYSGTFGVGLNWNGGQYFVREHPLFKDLPVNCGMNWPYESLVREGHTRYGLRMEGEELVAGCYNAQSGLLGTAVGIIPYGKGKIIVSTLRISESLPEPLQSTAVAKKLLCNYLEFAGGELGD